MIVDTLARSHKLYSSLSDAHVAAPGSLKTSHDGGKTWGNFQVLSPKGASSYSNAAILYDRTRKRLVVQYNYIPQEKNPEPPLLFLTSSPSTPIPSR